MDKRVGLLGGGQLGRMLAYPAALLNVSLSILDVGENAPAKQVLQGNHIDGSFSDSEKIFRLASTCDILTVEIEHVNVDALQEAQNRFNVAVYPSVHTLRVIQDKFLQKVHLASRGIDVTPYRAVESTKEAVLAAGYDLGFPLILKCRTLAYDGRGNAVVQDPSQIESALQALCYRPLYAEKWAKFDREIAVMVVCSIKDDICSYLPVETIHKNNICQMVFAPMRNSNPDIIYRARILAEQAAKTFETAGVFGVEMFLLNDDSLLVNEIAPRPHNSGHYTIEACLTSQYENHLRAILNLPLGSTEMKVPSCAMLNILGRSASFSDIKPVVTFAFETTGASVHLYGKTECRKDRKMGHITIVGDSDDQVRHRLRPLLLMIGEDESTVESFCPLSTQTGHSSKYPLIGIIMGSDSDLPVMLSAAHVLDDMAIPYELTIVSAHRTPDRLTDYAHSASTRGLRVIIAGAGGAAHLPGMVASMTSLPVIGVPVKGSSLDGVDSLYSIVQMPRGIPVATVAINNATNAGLLAARIIGLSITAVQRKVDEYAKQLEGQVLDKVAELERVGWEEYKKQ